MIRGDWKQTTCPYCERTFDKIEWQHHFNFRDIAECMLDLEKFMKKYPKLRNGKARLHRFSGYVRFGQ